MNITTTANTNEMFGFIWEGENGKTVRLNKETSSLELLGRALDDFGAWQANERWTEDYHPDPVCGSDHLLDVIKEMLPEETVREILWQCLLKEEARQYEDNLLENDFERPQEVQPHQAAFLNHTVEEDQEASRRYEEKVSRCLEENG